MVFLSLGESLCFLIIFSLIPQLQETANKVDRCISCGGQAVADDRLLLFGHESEHDTRCPGTDGQYGRGYQMPGKVIFTLWISRYDVL